MDREEFPAGKAWEIPELSLIHIWGWWNMDGSSGSVVPGEPMTTTHDNTIANNVFRNTITILGDAGAIYTLGDMPDTIISENYIDSIGTPGTDPYHIRGIHVDELSLIHI